MSSNTLNTTIVQSYVCFEVVYVKGVSVAQQLIDNLEKGLPRMCIVSLKPQSTCDAWSVCELHAL